MADNNLGPIAKMATRKDSNLRVSFEFFPPKTDKMRDNLWASVKKLEQLSPDFVSVTYGAGGSTRELTHQTVADIVKNSSTNAAAHLTCVGSDKAEIDEIAQAYWDVGVRHIVALRGDPQNGIDKQYEPTKNGYAYASDLVKGLLDVAPFDISVAAYPERHPESDNWGEEIDNLKRKVDAGATRAITQFFFSPDTFLRYQDKVLDAGINIPIIPGLMLQPNYQGIKRMSKMCHIEIPNWYHELFNGLDDDPATRQLMAATTAAELTTKLHDNGVNRFHFYTLNRSEISFMVCKILGMHTVSKDA